MAITLTLTVDEQLRIVATVGDEILAPPTPLTDLPRIDARSNPYYYDPYGLGHKLYAAMGGDALLARLQANQTEPHGVLYLITSDAAAALPWEYAAIDGREFLACRYAVLRLLPDARPAPPVREPGLHLVALAADPLVDERGNPRTRRLAVDGELAAIRDRLRARDAG